MSTPEKLQGNLTLTGAEDGPIQTSRRTFIQTLGTTVGSAMLAPGIHGTVQEAGYPKITQLGEQHVKKGMILPDKTYRTMELSLHLPPEGRFDIDVSGEMARARDAGTETVLLYAQDHWGYALYTRS